MEKELTACDIAYKKSIEYNIVCRNEDPRGPTFICGYDSYFNGKPFEYIVESLKQLIRDTGMNNNSNNNNIGNDDDDDLHIVNTSDFGFLFTIGVFESVIDFLIELGFENGEENILLRLPSVVRVSIGSRKKTFSDALEVIEKAITRRRQHLSDTLTKKTDHKCYAYVCMSWY